MSSTPLGDSPEDTIIASDDPWAPRSSNQTKDLDPQAAAVLKALRDQLRGKFFPKSGWHCFPLSHANYRDLAFFADANLTVPGDKLPAISAVAKELGWHLRRAAKEGEVVEYLAGLWSTCFVQQLLWRPWRLGNKSWSSTYRAPSWSWASSLNAWVYDVSVDLRLEKNLLVETLDRKTFPLGDDCFQELVGGYVRLRSWLWKINQPESTRMRGLFIALDSVRDSSKKQTTNGNQCLQRDTWLLPLILRPFAKHFLSIEGLVLRRDSAIDHHFTRAGYFSVKVPADGIVPAHTLERDDRNAIFDRIIALGLNDILDPTLRQLDKELAKHGFDEDIHPSAYEERIEDQRFLGNDAPLAAKWLYTVTLI